MAKKKKNKPTEGTDDFQAEKVSWSETIKGERFRFVCGVLVLAFSVFSLFSFGSYLFTWWADYDLVSTRSSMELLTDTSLNIRNIEGNLGAFWGHLMIRNSFGIAAFLWLVFATGLGLRLLHLPFPSLRSTLVHCCFFTLWISILLGSITLEMGRWSIFAGIMGYETAFYLRSILGMPGLWLLLFTLLCVFLAITINLSRHYFSWIGHLRSRKAQRREEAQDRENGQPTEGEPGASEEADSVILSANEMVRSTEKDDADEQGFSLWGKIQEAKSTASSLTEASPTEVPFIIEENTSSAPAAAVESDEDDTPAAPAHYGIETPYDPYLTLPHYIKPGLDLLEDYGKGGSNSNAQSAELIANKKLIENTLNQFRVEIAQIKATVGPTVTLYEIVPAPGVRISKIQSLENDIALSLSALGIRIIAPIPGKGTIGIEVPNQVKQIVPMKSMLESTAFRESKFDLPVAFGKTIQNECYIADLAKMPHLLMAGATGQGKSVGLNAIIASLLYKKHPADLKFVMVDPKKVELTLFNKIERHFLAKLSGAEDAIITDTKKVVRTLMALCQEMDVRYNLLKDAQVKNIKEYNAKFVSRRLNPNDGHRYLPYIVLVIDEFADLILTAGKEVELPIARLAQLARAIGIHLIIATQRPSVNVITGSIKANFPARIAFKVSSKIDSRTILDAGGAEQLIGKGDMLLSYGSEILRIQCALIDTPEIEKISDFIGEQRAYPTAYELTDVEETPSGNGNASGLTDERDPMFEEVAQLIVSTQQGSTSLIQRKLKLGYNRAGRLMDQLEDAGIVGPSQGSKAREVLIKDILSLEHILKSLDENQAS